MSKIDKILPLIEQHGGELIDYIQESQDEVKDEILKVEEKVTTVEQTITDTITGVSQRVNDVEGDIKDIKDTVDKLDIPKRLTEDELKAVIQPLIPEPLKADAYVLTEKDKKDIAETIEVPTVEKVVETIVEKTTEFVQVNETPEAIVEKINTSTSIIKKGVIDTYEVEDIKGLPEKLKKLEYSHAKAKSDYEQVAGAGGSGTGGGIQSIVAGTNISVDDIDPANPIVSATTPTLQEVTDEGATTTDTITVGGVTIPTMTAGSVMFAGASGLVSQDNRGFFWDNTNKIFNTAAAYGANYITNGDFTGSATGWTLGSGWVYSSNSVSKTSDGLSSLQQGITIQANTYVELNLTVSNLTVGNVTVAVGGVTQSTITTNGTYKYRFITTNNNGLTIAPSNTARLTIDAVSMYPYSGGGIRTSGGGYYGDRLIISRVNTNYNTATSDHLNLANRTGSNTNIAFTFGQSTLGVINANSSGVMTNRATAYHQWYVGSIDSGTQAAYFDTAGVKTTGGVFASGKVIAGSVNTTTPATIGLSSNGGYAGKGITVFTPITLTTAYQYVYADTTIAQACGGTTTIVCSDYTASMDCNNYDYIGCSWSGGTCDEFTDEENCNTWSPQCGWVTTEPCSIFDSDEGACTTTTGCTANYDGDCTEFGDEETCLAQSGCSWDGGCFGNYFTSCSGDYDIDPYCSGSEYGDCNGTASCSNINNQVTCDALSPQCSWSEILQLTLPANPTAFQGGMGIEYYIKKVGGTGTVKLLANTGDKIDGADDYSISTTNDSVHLHMYPLYESCLQYTSYETCIVVSGCSWGSDPCSAYNGDEGACTSEGCSYDEDNSTCYSTTGSCTGQSLQYYQWNILSNKN